MHEYSKLVFMQHCWICDGRVMQNWIEFINHHKDGLTGVDYSYDAEFSVFITSFWSIYQSKYTNNHLMSDSPRGMSRITIHNKQISSLIISRTFSRICVTLYSFRYLQFGFCECHATKYEYWLLFISSVSMSVNVKNLVIFWPWQLNINPCLTIRSEEQLLW